MQPVYLFDIAARRAEWLSLRQATIAENVANVDTPGFNAREVEPFEVALHKTALAMAATDSRHLSLSDSDPTAASLQRPRGWGIDALGEDVSLEQELIKSGEIARDYSLNVSIVKSFHRMWMASVRT